MRSALRLPLVCISLVFGIAAAACGDDTSTSSNAGGGQGGEGASGGGEGAAGAEGPGGSGGSGGSGCMGPEVCNGADDDCNGDTDEGDDLCGGGDVCQAGRCRALGEYVDDATFGGGASDVGIGVGAQSDGSIILAGSFRGFVDFGGGERTASQYGSMFVLGLDTALDYDWDETFGTSGSPSAWGLAINEEDDIVLAGQLYGSVDFGGGARNNDIFVLSLEPGGAYGWDRAYGSTGYGQALAVAVGPGGVIAHGGNFQGSTNFGGQTFSSAGYSDVYAASLTAGGEHRWSRAFGDPTVDFAQGVAFAPDGRAVVSGSFEGVVDMGGGERDSVEGSDIFVAVYDAGGEWLWDANFGDVGGTSGRGVAWCGDRIVAVGMFEGTVELGDATITAAGSRDGFIAVFDEEGSAITARRMGGTDFDGVTAVACGPDGSIYVAGVFKGTAEFGGENHTSLGDYDLFVAGFGPDLEHLWDRVYGAAGYETGGQLAFVPPDRIVFTGAFQGMVDFGGGARTSAGDHDAFVVVLRD